MLEQWPDLGGMVHPQEAHGGIGLPLHQCLLCVLVRLGQGLFDFGFQQGESRIAKLLELGKHHGELLVVATHEKIGQGDEPFGLARASAAVFVPCDAHPSHGDDCHGRGEDCQAAQAVSLAGELGGLGLGALLFSLARASSSRWRRSSRLPATMGARTSWASSIRRTPPRSSAVSNRRLMTSSSTVLAASGGTPSARSRRTVSKAMLSRKPSADNRRSSTRRRRVSSAAALPPVRPGRGHMCPDRSCDHRSWLKMSAPCPSNWARVICRAGGQALRVRTRRRPARAAAARRQSPQAGSRFWPRTRNGQSPRLHRRK